MAHFAKKGTAPVTVRKGFINQWLTGNTLCINSDFAKRNVSNAIVLHRYRVIQEGKEERKKAVHHADHPHDSPQSSLLFTSMSLTPNRRLSETFGIALSSFSQWCRGLPQACYILGYRRLFQACYILSCKRFFLACCILRTILRKSSSLATASKQSHGHK